MVAGVSPVGVCETLPRLVAARSFFPVSTRICLALVITTNISIESGEGHWPEQLTVGRSNVVSCVLMRHSRRLHSKGDPLRPVPVARTEYTVKVIMKQEHDPGPTLSKVLRTVVL